MAEFCSACTEHLLGGPPDMNDFVMIEPSDEGPFLALCEGCGIHLFDTDGCRIHDMPEGYYGSDLAEAFASCGPCSDKLGVEL